MKQCNDLDGDPYRSNAATDPDEPKSGIPDWVP